MYMDFLQKLNVLKPDKNIEYKKNVPLISNDINAFRKKGKGPKTAFVHDFKSFQAQHQETIPKHFILKFAKIVYEIKKNWSSNNFLKEIAEFENIGVQGPSWFLGLNEHQREFMLDFIGTLSYSPFLVKKFINYFDVSETKSHQFLRWYEYNIKDDGFKFSSTEIVNIGEFDKILGFRSYKSDRTFRNIIENLKNSKNRQKKSHHEADNENFTNVLWQEERIEESSFDIISKLMKDFAYGNSASLVFVIFVYTIYFYIYLIAFYLLGYDKNFFLAISFQNFSQNSPRCTNQ